MPRALRNRLAKLLMRKPSKRTLSIVAVVLLCLWGSFLTFIGWAMRQPPEKFGRVMSHMPMPAFFLFPFETMWTHARAGTVTPGEMAPDFRLPTLDHQSEVQLSALRGKPVVLVFGSYT
jgi:AhpC/TSA family